MNFQQLLQQRADLLRQARLANAAFAYQRLGDFIARLNRAQLHGLVALWPGEPAGEQPWPALSALEDSQVAIEEHFLDEDIVELVGILDFLGEDVHTGGLTFRLEELESVHLPRLRRELEAAGITVATPAPSDRHPNRGRA
jgi:hypothetical protein